MQPDDAWRGLVNQIVYGIDARRRVDDETVDFVATQLIAQRVFTHPVREYYDAARAALDAPVPTELSGVDQSVVRDFLHRLVQELYARRPWPEPLFRQVPVSSAPDALRGAPIATLRATQLAVTERLNRIFEPIPGDGGRRGLILELPDGSVVALIAPASFAEPAVEVRCAQGDPAAMRAAVQRLTGAPVTDP